MSQDAGYTVDTKALDWKPIAPGIEVAYIRASVETGQFTLLLRAEKGSIQPRHRHLAPAEFYILKGRGVHPQTGPWAEDDYVYEHTGAVHDAFTYTGDITLLMVSQGPVALLNDDNSVKGFMLSAF